MMFTRRKGAKHDAEPASREFTLRATVQSMHDQESPVRDGRTVCVLELYSHDPIMVNGETEHRFSVYIPNYHTNPRFNIDRMKFWLCYGHQQPVILGEHRDPEVPLIGQEDREYFTGRTLPFVGQVMRLEDGREVLELGYLPED